MRLEHYAVKVADLLPNIRAANPEFTGAALFNEDTKTLTWQAMVPGTMGLAHHPAPIASAINTRILVTCSSVSRDAVPRTRAIETLPTEGASA